MRTADAARGRWHGILSALSIPEEYLRNRHGRCPLGCGGKRSFRFDDKGGNGTWICTHCGAGDGIELVKRFFGCEAKEAMKMVDRVAQNAPAVKPKPVDYEARKRQVKQIWTEAKPISHGDPVAEYLIARLGFLPEYKSLRYHPALTYYWEGGEETEHPAMVALVWRGDKVVGIHRTYLQDGRKAQVPSPKKLLTCAENIAGAAVRLGEAQAVMGVAEGIETALAAERMFGIPVWSAISASGLASFEVPPVVEDLTICADNDVNGTGQLAAYTLMNRLMTRTNVKASVALPPTAGTDWADVWEQI